MSPPKLSNRRLALLSGIALLGVLGVASVCGAESTWRRHVARPAPPPYRVTLEALDGSGLPTFRHAGSTFVLGETGERYNIRVDNPTGERVEAVVTVDGRDAISGDVGDYVTQRGYLIEPWGSVVIEGFRRSLDEVAAFRFTGRRGSYSALRGTPQNVGVIGVAVFPEKARPAPVRARRDYRYDDAPRAPSAAEARPAPSYDGGGDRSRLSPPRKSSAGPSNIGTEYGESEHDRVVEVAFERRTPSHPSALLTLRYDDYDGLEARGVDLSSLGYAYRYEAPDEPDPFPYNRSRFAPPPRR
jgi:hypothetical protein